MRESASDALVVARHALRESLRRRVFAVVLGITAAFGVLYAWGASELFSDTHNLGGGQFGLDARTLAGATMLGLTMFGTLFLGSVLAVFLTIGAVRGDAETGLLQPLVVRPLGRTAYLGGRFLAAASVAMAYVAVVYTSAVVVTGVIGDWWPDHPVASGLRIALAVAVVAALSLLGSVFLTSTANGIGVLMVFGAGPGLRAAGHDRRGAELRAPAVDRRRRGVAAAVRGALPRRAAPARARHPRRHRRDRPARAARRLARRRTMAAAVDRRLRARRARARGARVRPPRPLGRPTTRAGAAA